MRRILLSLAASSLVVSGAVAQSQVGSNDYTVPATLVKQDPDVKKTSAVNNFKKSSANVLWSEDFANGIPSTWTNSGFDVDPATGNYSPNPLCLWEYRGPNTTPNNGTGSRGAYAAANDPIVSSTAANGFIIFDSDWLDNAGVAGAFGTGNSAAPHVGTLTTDVIDLTGYPYVELKMDAYLRHFSTRYLVALSSDGGVTFPDTVQFGAGIAVNSSSANPAAFSADISAVGDESNVVLQFIYDGSSQLPGAAATAYYYWMIDDISIEELPTNAFKFTDWQGAPERDVIAPANQPRYGNPQVDQAALMPINFDANAFNFGVATQYNVRLNVDIIDQSGSTVTTLQSTTVPVLNSGDTATFNDLTTTSGWTPSMVGEFDAVYYITSDSANAVTPYDTTTFSINDLTHSGHFNSLDNTIGIANQVLGLAQAFTFPSNIDTAGYVAIESISMYISTVSDTTGSIILELYDTTGFSYGSGGGPAGAPITVKSFPLSASVIGRTSAIDMTDNNGCPLYLPANAGYMVVLNLVSTAGDMRIGNDQTIRQGAGFIGMLYSDGNWYSGFTGSRSLSNLIINMRATTDYSCTISLEEALARQNAVSVYPNPSTTGNVNLEMVLGGTYNIEVTTLTGQRVHAETVTVNGGEVLERNFSGLGSGAYLINFTGEEVQITKKLVIE